MSSRIGVDIGGTFTDVVFINDGKLYRGKSDTTHYDLKIGFMNAAKAAIDRAGSTVEQVLQDAQAIVYSTTVGTNALIERRGTKLGLITTKGFEHTVQVGRARNWGDGLPTEKKYDRGRAMRPEPIIPQHRIIGIQERIDNLGNVIVPMSDEEVKNKVQKLVDEGVRGFVVVTLNAFINPDHERRIGKIILEQYPECYLGHMPVYLSHQISPKSGEYRRSMTVIIDAYLRDLTEGHVLRLSDDLRDLGYNRPIFVAKNTGGLSSLSRSQALHLLGSSPASTVIGSDYIGETIGSRNVIVSDMGGTSFDVGLVVEGQDKVYEYDPVVDRFRVQIPYVAHWSVGAGGGSIAKVVAGELRVGPESAGSNPGPACYGRGGLDATVTDADIVLGYINPDNFLGGEVSLDAQRSKEVIKENIADPLGINVVEAAWRIKRLIDGYMGQEMYRICALTSGQDPRDFVLFALGGAGPVHAAGYAEGADVNRIATFPFSSVFGAFSTLTLDVLQTYEKTLHLNLYSHSEESYGVKNIEAFNKEVGILVEFAERDLQEEGFDFNEIEFKLDIKMCYGQQRQTLPINVPKLKFTKEADIISICEDFNQSFASKYGEGACYPEAGIELVELQLNAVAPSEKYQLKKLRSRKRTRPKVNMSRMAHWGPEYGSTETPVYLRDDIVGRSKIEGPALIEAHDTVIVTPPGWVFVTDDWGVGWIEKKVVN